MLTGVFVNLIKRAHACLRVAGEKSQRLLQFRRNKYVFVTFYKLHYNYLIFIWWGGGGARTT